MLANVLYLAIIHYIAPLAVRFPIQHSGKADPWGFLFIIKEWWIVPTAILVDGGFFIKRYRQIYTKPTDLTAERVAKNLHQICIKLLSSNQKEVRPLYRIFYYDCPPLRKKAHNPFTKKAVDFSKTEEALFRSEFHAELRKLRKVALRLGRLSDSGHWQLKPIALKGLLDSPDGLSGLKESDLFMMSSRKALI